MSDTKELAFRDLASELGVISGFYFFPIRLPKFFMDDYSAMFPTLSFMSNAKDIEFVN